MYASARTLFTLKKTRYTQYYMLDKLVKFTSPLGAFAGVGLVCYTCMQDWGTQWIAYIWLLLALVGITLLGYLLASRLQATAWGEVFRGFLVGVSAGINGVLLYWLTASTWLAGAMVGLLWLAASLKVSRRAWYHSLLGYLNWVLPLSWPVNLPGFLICVVNLVVMPLGYLHPLFTPLRLRVFIHLPSCTITQYGGLIRPVKGFSGLNMGNFIFINPGHEHLLKHEIGHLFSLAAMGSVFHYIGGIDEGYIQQNYWEAYAEYLAESYATPTDATISMWRAPAT